LPEMLGITDQTPRYLRTTTSQRRQRRRTRVSAPHKSPGTLSRSFREPSSEHKAIGLAHLIPGFEVVGVGVALVDCIGGRVTEALERPEIRFGCPVLSRSVRKGRVQAPSYRFRNTRPHKPPDAGAKKIPILEPARSPSAFFLTSPSNRDNINTQTLSIR
jgi:hypothetical protein